ncbi:hypothetical protein LLG46_09045 [bacterium]|nr:hypothetical protein [bacterium]
MNNTRAILSMILFVLTIFIGSWSAAWAYDAIIYIELSDDYSAMSLSNDYVEAYIGIDGTVTVYDTDGDSTEWEVAGRYSAMSIMGDPETTDDDNAEMTPWGSYPFGPLGYWKVKVGDNTPVLIGAGSDGSGSWSTEPKKYDTPIVGTTLGPGGPYIEGEWLTAGTTPVAVKINISLVRDQIRYALTITNKATTTQSIGLGMFGIPKVTNSSLHAYPYVEGIGMTRANGVSDSFPGTIFSGTKVPERIEFYDSVDSPERVTRFTFDEQDSTVPDYVAVGEWESGGLIMTSTWLPDSYSPDPLVALDAPCCLIEWKQKSLAAGASRTYVTYYGIGAASEKWTYKSGTKVVRDSVTAAVQGPSSLKYDSTDPDVNLVDITPDPFTISAYVYNTTMDSGPYNLEDVSAYLYLPDGLELASGSTAKQEIGDVPTNSESDVVTWSVKPTGEYCGELEYYVVFSDESGWSQTVTRTIMVPAAKKAVLRYGYQMVSVPFEFNNPTFEHAFGLTSGYKAVSYDLDAKEYVTLSQLEPGKAFWVNVYSLGRGGQQTYSLAEDAAIVGEYYGKQYKEQDIELSKGWNMIGNPFVYPVYIGQLMVYNKTTNTSYSYEDAVKKGWLSKTIYGWSLDTSSYETLSANDEMLVPWNGYWVRAKTPVTLIFRPAIFPDSGVTSLSGGY